MPGRRGLEVLRDKSTHEVLERIKVNKYESDAVRAVLVTHNLAIHSLVTHSQRGTHVPWQIRVVQDYSGTNQPTAGVKGNPQ